MPTLLLLFLAVVVAIWLADWWPPNDFVSGEEREAGQVSGFWGNDVLIVI